MKYKRARNKWGKRKRQSKREAFHDYVKFLYQHYSKPKESNTSTHKEGETDTNDPQPNQTDSK